LIADPAGKASLRLDVGVLDKTGFVLAFNHSIGGSQRRIDITADDATADENVIGTLFVYQARIWGESIVDVVERRQSFPGHGEIAFFKCLD
jgi:hypothetical protein